MDISIEDMRECIQEWFAQAWGFDDLRDIYNAVRSEADKQFEYIADSIAKQRAEDGFYKNNV